MASHVRDRSGQSGERLLFWNLLLLRKEVRSLFSNLLCVGLSSNAMTFNDQPNTPQIELVGGEPDPESANSDEESSGSESVFEFDSR